MFRAGENDSASDLRLFCWAVILLTRRRDRNDRKVQMLNLLKRFSSNPPPLVHRQKTISIMVLTSKGVALLHNYQWHKWSSPSCVSSPASSPSQSVQLLVTRQGQAEQGLCLPLGELARQASFLSEQDTCFLLLLHMVIYTIVRRCLFIKVSLQ